MASKGKDFIEYSGLGFQMLALILGGVFGGIWLDERYGTSPVWTLVLTLSGVVLSMVQVIVKFNKNS